MFSRKRQPQGIPTGGQFAVAAKTESGVVLIPEKTEAARIVNGVQMLDEPETQTLDDGTEITNYVAAPITHEDGIFAYGSTCFGDRYEWIKQTRAERKAGLEPKNVPFSGSVYGPNNERLFAYSGLARSHQEGWDRCMEISAAWAQQYDRRPSRLSRGERPAQMDSADQQETPK